MRKLTQEEILDLAYESGLQVIEENGLKGNCGHVTSYKEWLKDMNRKDSKKSFKGYKVSLEFADIDVIDESLLPSE